MNKAQLVDAIAKKTGDSKAAAERGLNSALDAIKAALKKGDTVQLIGFGSFAVKTRKARKGINPQTKERINIKQKKVPVFRAGAELKKLVK